MTLLQYVKSHLIISFILLLVIISIIMLPIYFLVINKSSSSSSSQITIPKPKYTINPNELGFIITETKKSVDQPARFMPIDMFNLSTHMTDADNADIKNNLVSQYKWYLDKNIPFSIERLIPNTNNNYSQDELSNLGKTDKPDVYLVNKIIPKYDPNHILLSEDVLTIIKPMIYASYGYFQNNYSSV